MMISVRTDPTFQLVVQNVVDEESPPAITVVENWFRELDERE